MESFALLIIVVLILGVFAYITRPANQCYHNWETSTPVENEQLVVHEHICNKCGKIESSYYFKQDSWKSQK